MGRRASRKPLCPSLLTTETRNSKLYVMTLFLKLHPSSIQYNGTELKSTQLTWSGLLWATSSTTRWSSPGRSSSGARTSTWSTGPMFRLFVCLCRFSFTYFLNANHNLSGQPRQGLFLLSPTECEQPPLPHHARKDHQGLKSFPSTTALSTCTSPRCLTWSPLRFFPWSKRLQGRGCMRRKSNKLRKPSRKRMQGKSHKFV